MFLVDGSRLDVERLERLGGLHRRLQLGQGQDVLQGRGGKSVDVQFGRLEDGLDERVAEQFDGRGVDAGQEEGQLGLLLLDGLIKQLQRRIRRNLQRRNGPGQMEDLLSKSRDMIHPYKLSNDT